MSKPPPAVESMSSIPDLERLQTPRVHLYRGEVAGAGLLIPLEEG